MSELEADWPEPEAEQNRPEESLLAALTRTSAAPAEVVATGSAWTTITLADAFLFLLTGVAIIRNLADLDHMPFSVAEAVNGLASWSLWQPASAVDRVLPLSPGLTSLASPLTQIIGVSDSTIRLLPALFGAAIVFLPWLLRHRLGAIGMLVSSSLLLVSPTITATARTASGSSIALCAAFLLFICAVRFFEAGRATWLYGGAAALGLGLTSAPLFYGLLVTGLAGWGLGRRYGVSWEKYRPEIDSTMRRQAIIIFVAVFAAASTMFLWAPSLMATTFSLAGAWLQQFFTGESLLAWISPTLALGRYEVALVLLGLTGISWATWSGHPLGSLLTYWFSAGLVLILLQGDVVENVLLLVLPGYLLSGLLAQAMLTQTDRWGEPLTARIWPFVVAGTVLLFAAFINLSRFLRHALTYPDENGFLFIAIFSFVFFLLVAALPPLLDIELIAIGQYFLLAALALLLFYSWGTAWWLTHDAANNPLERWVAMGTDDDILKLRFTLKEISQQAHGSAEDLNIFVAHESPVLHWYLRGFENLAIGEAVPANVAHDVIITSIDADPNLNAAYLGSDFVLYQQKPAVTADATAHWSDVLRWWIFHRSRDVTTPESLIVWVRADLAR